MGAPAPQWLFSAFVEAMAQIGATASAPMLQAEARDLVTRWNAPERTYHNLHHLIEILAHIDELSTVAHDPDVLRIAYWYHGAFLNRALEVQVLGADPNHMCTPCMDHALSRLQALGVSSDVILRIVELLHTLVTRKVQPGDSDAQVLLDADRSVLASSPQVYKRYRQLLREEFADLDDLTYWRARRRVVKKLLARDAIFLSPLGERWEDAARANLEVDLVKLDGFIANADPDEDSESEVTEEESPTTGTLIIRRKRLHKNVLQPVDEPTSTGILPIIRPNEATADSGSSNGGSRSVDSLGSGDAGINEDIAGNVSSGVRAGTCSTHDEDDLQSSLESAIDDMDLPELHGED